MIQFPVISRRLLLVSFLILIYPIGVTPSSAQSNEIIPVLPSTLLPPGTTEMDFSVQTNEPAECRYAMGTNSPFEAMTPMSIGSGTTFHQVRLIGLSANPNDVNRVFVRCDSIPDSVLEVHYRSLSEVNPPYPRVGNLWGSWNYEGRMQDAARIDLWLGAEWNADEIRELRLLNPHVRVLGSVNAVEPSVEVPDAYYLKDVNGAKVEVWPGSFRLNLTKPEVAAFQARYAYQLMLDSDLMLDGMFFDNVFTSQSWQTSDIYGRPFAIDADEDGQPDDPESFDAAWRAGVLNEIRLFRQWMPHALISGHAMDISDPEIAALFNGISIGFDVPFVIEGRISFSELWAKYNRWQTDAVPPPVTMIESAVPLQIGYGYGYMPLDEMPSATLDFARDYYPYMRFGLALTLMQDGYFAHEIGDTYHGNNWWYDELDADLGFPLGPAQVLQVSDEMPASVVLNGDFEGGSIPWQLWVDSDAGADALFSVDQVDGSAAAQVVILSAAPEEWQIELNQPALPLEKDVVYDLTFRAKASEPRMIAVSSQKDSPDWRDYGLYAPIRITDDWAEYRTSFVATETVDDARMQFFLGQSPGVVWIDDVHLVKRPPDVLRRDFSNGLVLLNATRQPQTISLGALFWRIRGEQAPLVEMLVDDRPPTFETEGEWSSVVLDSGEWKAVGPYYHDWGEGSHLTLNGSARWNLGDILPDTYTLTVWWPAAPEASTWNAQVLFEVISGGQVVVQTVLDQRSGGDQWHLIGEVDLQPGAYVQMRCDGTAPCAADALHVRSAARYNDGMATDTVTLAPMDGILMQRAR